MNNVQPIYEFQDYGTPMPVVFVLLFVGLISLPLYDRYLKGLKGRVFAVWLLGVLLGLLSAAQRLNLLPLQGVPPPPPIPAEKGLWTALLAGMVLSLSAVALVYKLYRKWLGGDVTPEEKASGTILMGAWFSGSNIACCIMISLGAWQGYGYSFWGVLAWSLCALGAYPLIHSLSATETESATPVPAEDLSSERERVLKLLESGKITVDESTQLLSALGETIQPPLPRKAPITPTAKMVLAGGFILLVGFFLPWFVVNVGQELSQAARQLGNLAHVNLPMNLNTGSTRISGGDIPHGLGWVILLLGMAAVVLPYLNPGLSRVAQLKVSLAALGIGLLVLIYLLTENLRFASIGFILTVVGYVLMLAGTLKEARGTLTMGAVSRNPAFR